MFSPGRIYRRSTLHEVWGGTKPAQGQVGILTPKQAPLVLVITGSGEKYGYDDYRDDDGVWHYYGRGKSGDMKMSHGNKAIRDHSVNGEALHLFESVGTGILRHLGEFICGEYEFIEGSPDEKGELRTAIVFSLLPVEAINEPPTFDPELGSGRSRWDIPIEDLRAMASSSAQPQGHAPGARRSVFYRSEALRVYVQRRASGKCEGCGEPAPFLRKDGTPYLEPHHTTRLADGGPDHPNHVIALCPTCHRRVHSGEDGDQYNRELIGRIPVLEREFGRIQGFASRDSRAVSSTCNLAAQ